MSETNIRIQDDLYEAVNGEWLKTAVIPEDRPVTGGFSDLDQGVEKIMMADFEAFAKGEKTSDIPEMRYAIALYRKCGFTETGRLHHAVKLDDGSYRDYLTMYKPLPM